MSIVRKAERNSFVSRKVNIREDIYRELLEYVAFLGYGRGSGGINQTINAALEHVFRTDREYREYKKKEACIRGGG